MAEAVKTPRCQKCGTPVSSHDTDCYEVTRASFDYSHEQLSKIDEAAGFLLSAIMRYKSVEALQSSTFGAEFFNLLDLRRRS